MLDASIRNTKILQTIPPQNKYSFKPSYLKKLFLLSSSSRIFCFITLVSVSDCFSRSFVSSKAGIGHAIDYVTKKEKTEEKLVSGLHCEPETVKEEMQATKELWGKTDGRTYKHYVQSYHEDEKITPEQAHKNAVELAEHTKAWKGHEVLIATHIDK